MSVTIVPFAEDHIEPAAALLAERHRCDRAWAPGLPAAYEGVEATRSVLASLTGDDGASGVAALRGGRLTGYLLATREFGSPTTTFAGFVRPRSVDIPYAGHAVETTECGALHRALYAALAEQWVAEGLVAHYTTIPVNRVSADAWLDLGFARYIDMGVFEIALAGGNDDSGDDLIRLAGPDDEDAVRMLTSALFRSFADAPIFVPFLPETNAARQQFVTEHLGDAACPHWLAFREGRPIAMLMFEEPISPHWHQSPLQSPDKGLYLFLACTVPEARSTGIGAALFRRAMTWAREAGYERCAVHYLTSSRAASFWRGLGFQPVSHWMVRNIDERAIWANGRAG